MLTELKSTPVSATLLKSLRYVKYLLLCPLLQFLDHLNVTLVGQLFGNRNLQEGFQLVQQFIPPSCSHFSNKW